METNALLTKRTFVLFHKLVQTKNFGAAHRRKGKPLAKL